MRVTVHFLDGERMDGSSEAMTLTKSGFPVTPDEGNNELVWVSLGSMKYVAIYAGNVEVSEQGDPREGRGLPKVVIRFRDGETIRTYRDDSWGQDGEGFALRVWDRERRSLVRVLVSMHSVKGIFFVKEWDSRSAEERLRFAGRSAKANGKGHREPAVVGVTQRAAAAEGPIAELGRRYRKLLAEVGDRRLATGTPAQFAEAVRFHVPALLRNDGINLTPLELSELVGDILQNAFGYGPIDPLLLDPRVTEIMANGPHDIFVEREGRIQRVAQSFENDAALLDVIKKMAAAAGRRIDESSPMVDARLPDGSRINAVIPPATVDAPLLTIRRFSPSFTALDDLVQQGTLSVKAALFLHDAVVGRANLLLSGGTGSGKTTTLNVLGSLIPPDQRVVTIEDTAELQLSHPHVLRLEYRPPNVEGRGELTIAHLLRNSLRMRPDRIIIGEVRSWEALEMLQAMNTGHDGSMSTIHANSARDALIRLETMVMSGSIDLPLRAVRSQVVNTIDLVLHHIRRGDGHRQVTQISEVGGHDHNGPVLRPIFAIGGEEGSELLPTGLVPRCLSKLAFYGVEVDPRVFLRDGEASPPATDTSPAPASLG